MAKSQGKGFDPERLRIGRSLGEVVEEIERNLRSHQELSERTPRARFDPLASAIVRYVQRLRRKLREKES